MNQNNLVEEKWRKFLRLRPIFGFIPFLDFVIASGSLAFGNVSENSDFDVIIGAKSGRIFTVRAFCVFVFGILGIRRKGIDHKRNSSDKVCFSHFVTPKSYRLSPPYNDYWIKLYQNLVPVYGKEKAVRNFFKINDWSAPISRQMPQEEILNGKYWKEMGFNPIRSFLEFILSGFLGNFFENFTKKIQVRAIERGIKNGSLGFKPLVRYDDEELRFHIDTSRIEKMVRGGKI